MKIFKRHTVSNPIDFAGDSDRLPPLPEYAHKIYVLFLEGNADDVELEIYELRKGGFKVSSLITRNRQEFLNALEAPDFDIIITGYCPASEVPRQMELSFQKSRNMPALM